MEASVLERTDRRAPAYPEKSPTEPHHDKAHPASRHDSSTPLGFAATKAANARGRFPRRRNKRMSVAGREAFDWLPVFELTTEVVLQVHWTRAAPTFTERRPRWAYRAVVCAYV